ncbi:hypothetical protein [Deinococcus navajonensis]|uniref:Uncharacterized protein n=1 Tax=Deinococcus navajonensis TaxID=309884 RepID=A0ABV8XKU6_9DEIO
MDVDTKLALPYQDFGQYASEVGSVFSVPTYTVPVAALPHLIRRLAELDIGDLDGIEFAEFQSDQQLIHSHPNLARVTTTAGSARARSGNT